MLARFDRVVTTPNVLSEVNSLSNVLRGVARDGYFAEFARKIVTLHEEYVVSAMWCVMIASQDLDLLTQAFCTW